MPKRKKGTSRSRICLLVFILILAGTLLLNILFMLQTTSSRRTSAEKEPMEYDYRFHRILPNSVAPSVQYWMNEKTSLPIAGKHKDVLTCLNVV